MSTPDFWKTVQDPLSGRKDVLNEEELSILCALSQGRTAKTATSLDPHEDAIDFFTYDKMTTALTAANETKKSFIPSLLDRKKVGHLVHLIKSGKLKVDQEKKEEEKDQKFYDLWGDFTQDENKTKSQMARLKMHIPAPKASLPGHNESYRPPPEFIPDDNEKKEWEENEEDRKHNFLPQMFKTLRNVPGYARFINERFERCLDLYLCPRQRKMKINVDPDSLIPKLPKPKDLQPFPMVDSLKYEGHKDKVICVDICRSGQYISSGSYDGEVKVWDVLTGYCLKTIKFEESIKAVKYYPLAELSTLLLVASGNAVYKKVLNNSNNKRPNSEKILDYLYLYINIGILLDIEAHECVQDLKWWF